MLKIPALVFWDLVSTSTRLKEGLDHITSHLQDMTELNQPFNDDINFNLHKSSFVVY